jgi:Zn-dependent protease
VLRLAFLLALGSCSFAFMSAPTSSMPADCNAGLEAPVTDTVIAGAAAAGLAATLVASETSDRRWFWETERLLPIALPLAILHGASAAYGYISRDHCRSRHVETSSGLANN